MTTIAYIRVSTDQQADLGLSLEAQEKAIRAYCGLYDLGEPKIFTDAGKSAKSLNGRPAMARLLRYVDSGAYSDIVVYKIDRMFRNIGDGAVVLDRFRAQGVRFHSVMEKWDTSTAIGEAMLNIVLVFAQLERRQTGERTAAVLQATKTSPGGSPILNYRRAHKILMVGRAPYGFAWQGLGKERRLVEVPEEMAKVRRIFDLRRKGKRSKNIAIALAVEGVKRRDGRAFDARRVRAILARPFYREHLKA